MALLASVSCSRDGNDDPPTPPPGGQTAAYTEGDEVISEFLVDGTVRERLEEEVVNLGDERLPAMFFIRKSHTVREQQVADGASSYNAFRSLELENLQRFVLDWGQVIGVPVTEEENADNRLLRAEAFWLLAAFLRENHIDPPILIKLAERQGEEVGALVSLIEESQALYTRGSKNAIRPNELLLALESSGVTARELVEAIQNEGQTVHGFLSHCAQSGIDLPLTLMRNATRGVTSIIKGVFKAAEVLSKIIIFFVENGAPTVDLEDSYVSFLHADDLDYGNYLSGKSDSSARYEVRYGTKGTPLAKAVFFVETAYQTKHRTVLGTYIARLGMIVTEVRCSGMMHVDGYMEFHPLFENDGTEANPIAAAQGSITLNYGDCCCFSRHANLTFRVSGETGFMEKTWTPK